MTKEPYNILNFPKYSMELTRGDVFSSLRACFANTFLLYQQHIGLHPNINLKVIVTDRSKIDREWTRTISGIMKILSVLRLIVQVRRTLCKSRRLQRKW